MRYRIRFENRASREMRRLLTDPIYPRVSAAIDGLQDDPRPPGCKKLSVRQAWRIVSGITASSIRSRTLSGS
jgi:mRNA interferase RelE/StbE